MDDSRQSDFDIYSLLEEHRNTLTQFYKPYFDTQDKLVAFVKYALSFEKENEKAQQMINQVYNFVSLSNDIEQIRPNRDSFRVFFLKICLDSLQHILGGDKSHFFEKFEKNFSDEAKLYILSSFDNIYVNDIPLEDYLIARNNDNTDFTLHHFFNMIKAIRDNIVHEGTYWTTQFFSSNNYTTITSLTTDADIFGSGKKEKSTYFFHTSLNYSKFIYYFVEACIKLICEENNISL